jgi:predicted nucleotidyltransferase
MLTQMVEHFEYIYRADKNPGCCELWTYRYDGKVLRDDFAPDSDIDVLVEFEPDHRPGLAFFAIQEELSALLGREVDLLTFEDAVSMENYIRRRHILNAVRLIIN